jgi:immune inhibitor A
MKFSISRMLFFIFLSLIWQANILAVSLSDEVVKKLRDEGKLEEWVESANLARAKGVWQPNPNPPLGKSGKGNTSSVDSLRAIVLLVDFSDNAHSLDTSQFSSLLFSQGTFPTGSMKDFYRENSYQRFDLSGAVYGWIRLDSSYSYYVNHNYGYGSYPRNSQKLVEDAVSAANPYVNFANFDKDGDGWVDALFVVHAGKGAEETGSQDDIWSHSWNTTYTMTVDGVSISDYSIEPEKSKSGDMVHVGVFCHEFGHILGLPDLYDTDNSSEGLGHWSLMASGSWTGPNNNGSSPAHLDAWSKDELGWIEVDTLTSNLTNEEILQIETNPKVYRLWTNGGTGFQYFLVENRQKTGFDSYLDGEGILIYHVDENISNNNNEWYPGHTSSGHYKIALQQADGFFDLEKRNNRGDTGDPFLGSRGKIAFDDTTTPDSRNYSFSSTQVAVWNVSNSDSVMHANLDVTWSRPCLFLDSFRVDDSAPGGNGNGRPERGETAKIYVTIRNIWLPLTGATVTGSADTAGIVFTHPTSNLGTIGTSGSANNHLDPIVFWVDTLFPGRPTTITLHVAGNGGIYSLDFDKEIWAGNAEILLVDDDSGSVADYKSYYTNALNSLQQLYDVWDTQGKGNPDFSFNMYKYLIWYTGDHKTSLFTQAQVESLMSFLDKGGRLFLTSQDAVEVLSGSSDPEDTLFLKHYLHVGYNGNDSKHLIAGKPGDEVGDTLWIWPEQVPGAYNQTSKDNLVPDAQADKVMFYANTGFIPDTTLVAATKFQSDTFKVVVFGFGFEAINSSGNFYQNHWLTKPLLVMQRVIDWLKATPAINVLSPNGGETWEIGDTVDILWQSISFKDSVKIEFSTDAGANWIVLDDTAFNDGIYSWIIPNTPSESCLVRISDVVNGIPFDQSDGYFSIPPPTIDVMSPNGGEIWMAGDTVDILWQSISFRDSVKIEYSLNGGVGWLPIADTTTNDGVYSWIVPDTLSNNCLVKISDVTTGIPFDASDSLFSIINYVPGDLNGDRLVQLLDIVFLINYLYKGGATPNPLAVADINHTCTVDLLDVVYMINYVFKGGQPPRPGCA